MKTIKSTRLPNGVIIGMHEWHCTRKSFVGPQSLLVSDFSCLDAIVQGLVTSGFSASVQGLEPFRVSVDDRIYIDGLVADWSFGAQHERYYKFVHRLAQAFDCEGGAEFMLTRVQSVLRSEQEFKLVEKRLAELHDLNEIVTMSNIGTVPLHLPEGSRLRIEAPEWCRTTLSLIVKRSVG